MIRKTASSEIIDEYVAAMLKKEAGAGGAFETILDLGTGAAKSGDEVAGAAAAGVKATPPAKPVAPGAAVPGKPKPPAKPPTPPAKPPAVDPEIAAAAKAASEAAKAAAEEAAIQAARFNWTLRMLVDAMSEATANGKVINPQNPFFGETAEAIMKKGDSLLSDEVFGAWIKKLESARDAVPKTYSAHKKVAAAVEGLQKQRIAVMEAQRGFRQSLAKAGDEAAKAAEVAADAGKVVEETSSLGAELSGLYGKTISDLQAAVGQLTTKNEELVERLLKSARSSGYWKGVVKGMERAGLETTSEYKVIREVAETAAGDTVRASEKAASATPNPAKAAPVLDSAAGKAGAAGSEAGVRAVGEGAETGAEVAGKGAGSPGTPGTPKAPDTKAPNPDAKLGPADKAAKALADAEKAKKAQGILARALGGFGEVAGKEAGKIAAGVGVVLMLVGVGGAIWFFKSDAGKRLASDLEKALSKAIALLTNGNVQFTVDSGGLVETNDLIATYREGMTSLNSLSSTEDESTLREHASVLGEVQSESQDYIDDEAEIAQDLVVQMGWEDAIDSIQEVKRLSELLATTILENAERARAEGVTAGGDNDTPSAPGAGVTPGIRGPIAKSEEGEESTDIPIPGTNVTLDFANAPKQSAGFRSAALKIIKKVLTSPPGLAFVDPEGAIWTGALTRSSKSPDENYYWRTIGYLYEHAISTPGKLRRHMKNQLKRWKRGRGTAWKEALKHYRGRVANKYSMEFYLDDIIKSAKSNSMVATSINKEGNHMKIQKFSDEHSNSYIQDALKGLSDDYAKSYFAGLKGMYDERLGSSEADQIDLYHPLGGTGAETIGEAHKESLTIAESMGRGGLVENLLEQQKANYEVALSAPSGNFRNKRANLLNALVKEANTADIEGNIELSNLIDEIIVELTNE